MGLTAKFNLILITVLGIGFVVNIHRDGCVACLNQGLQCGVVGEAQVTAKPQQCL